MARLVLAAVAALLAGRYSYAECVDFDTADVRSTIGLEGVSLCEPGDEEDCSPSFYSLVAGFWNPLAGVPAVLETATCTDTCGPIGSAAYFETCSNAINDKWSPGPGGEPFMEEWVYKIEILCDGTWYDLLDLGADVPTVINDISDPDTFGVPGEQSGNVFVMRSNPKVDNGGNARAYFPNKLQDTLCPAPDADNAIYTQPWNVACPTPKSLSDQSILDFPKEDAPKNDITNGFDIEGAFIFRTTYGAAAFGEQPDDNAAEDIKTLTCNQVCGPQYCDGGGGGGDPWLKVPGMGEVFVDMPSDGVTQINLVNHDGGFSINATAYRLPEDPVDVSYFGSVIIQQAGYGTLTVAPTALDASKLSKDAAVATLTHTDGAGDVHTLTMPAGETRVLPGNLTVVCEPLAARVFAHTCVVSSHDGDVVEVSVLPADKSGYGGHMHCDVNVLTTAPGKQMRGLVYQTNEESVKAQA